jgi:hypothetical protein
VRPNSRKAADLTPLAACNGTHVTGQGRTCTGALRCPPHDRRPLQAVENFSRFGWMLDSPRSLGSGQAGHRPRLGSASCGRPATSMTVPPAHPMATSSAHPCREPAPPRRPAAFRIRLPDRLRVHHLYRARHPGWPHSPKPSPNFATPSGSPPRPAPLAPPTNGCTPPRALNRLPSSPDSLPPPASPPETQGQPRPSPGRTATSATAATTQATWAYPLTMRARTAQRIRR